MRLDYLACAASDMRPLAIPLLLEELLAGAQLSKRPGGGRICLFTSDDLPLRRGPGPLAVLLGHVFTRAGAPAPPAIGAADAEGDAIIARWWGSYVRLAAREGRIMALRDPSGGLACYHAERDGLHYFTSLPHLLIEAGLVAATINWPILAKALSRRAEREPATALIGVDEILPGTECSYGTAGEACRPVWDPWDHAIRQVEPEPVEALRGCLSRTLAAWGGVTRRPLIEISGGLDSAIVAAGLAPAAPGASLITFAAGPGDPDETAYAKAIAERLGLALEIARPRIQDVDLARSLSADLPRPNARAFAQAADAASLRHGRALGVDAFVSGGGGDDVFCYLRTVLPAIDRLRVEGARAMTATALDIARMNHSTLWQAMVRITGRLVRGRTGKAPLDTSFIHPDWVPATPSLERDRRDRPPGKAAHVCGILTIHNYLEGHARSRLAPILSPLLSQPVVECCLGIPTWRWCAGGANRAVARQAFADRLPAIVVERRSKGCLDGFCARLLEANRPLVRAMLLEGRLAAAGLLDVPALAAALADPAPSPERVARILTLVDVESWLSAWSARPLQRG